VRAALLVLCALASCGGGRRARPAELALPAPSGPRVDAPDGEDALAAAAELVARRIELVLLDGGELPASQASQLADAMRTASRRWSRVPLSQPEARRFDVLLALDHLAAPQLRLARVAEALLWAAGAPPPSGETGGPAAEVAMPPALAQAAQGALVWQARRALGQAPPADAGPDRRARLLASGFVAACPSLFALLPADGGPPVDLGSVKTGLPMCELGPGQVPALPDNVSVERELVRRVLIAADEALSRLRGGPGGAGRWRADADALERALAAGVVIPYELARAPGSPAGKPATLVEGVELPEVASLGAAPPLPVPRPAHVFPAGATAFLLSPPRMSIELGIVTVDDAPSPERRLDATQNPPPYLTIADTAAPLSAVAMGGDDRRLLVRSPAGLGALAFRAGTPPIRSQPIMIEVEVNPPRVTVSVKQAKPTTLTLTDAPAALAAAVAAPSYPAEGLVVIQAPGATPIGLLAPLLAAAQPRRTYLAWR